MAGTGWQAYPDLKEALPFTVVETEITLPAAQDMYQSHAHQNALLDQYKAQVQQKLYLNQ
mgnify:CR=1 FL=1